MAPLEQAGEGVGRKGAGFAEATEQGVAPEFAQGFPAASVGEVEGGIDGEHAGGGEHVDVGVPEQVVTKGLHGDDEAGLAGGAGGAITQPEREHFVGGVVELAEQGGLALKNSAQHAGEREDEVAVRDVLANLGGDGGGFGEGAALVAGSAEAALFTSEGEQVVVAAVGAVEAGEAGMEVAAALKAGQGLGGGGFEVGEAVGVVAEDLPDGRGAGLAWAIAGATHGGGGWRR